MFTIGKRSLKPVYLKYLHYLLIVLSLVSCREPIINVANLLIPGQALNIKRKHIYLTNYGAYETVAS